MIRVLRCLSALAYAFGLIAVGAFSLLPQAEVPGPEGTDKLAHLAAYALIAAAAGFGFSQRRDRFYAGAFALALGIALEIAQGHVPHRQPSVADVLANTAGVLVGLAVAALTLRAAGILRRETDTIAGETRSEHPSGRPS